VVQLLLDIGLNTAFTLTATTAVSASLVLKDRHTPVLLLSGSNINSICSVLVAVLVIVLQRYEGMLDRHNVKSV
jgi:hypothetical protein